MFRYFLLLNLLLSALILSAQDILLTEDFEDTTTVFSLNTEGGPLGGTGATRYNSWIINDVYTGGSGTLAECILGLLLPYNVPATSAQPMNIAGAPQSRYMHIVSDTARADGIGNANFLAPDGFCFFAQQYVAEMPVGIQTATYDSVELSFYWICGVGTASTGTPGVYGELLYSIDGGMSWTLLAGSSIFNSQTSWTQSTFSLPVFAGQSDLRFAFRFINGLVLSASDPGFAIDQLQVTGFTQTSITADSVDDRRFCSSIGGSSTLYFTSQGNFGGSNVVIAELSDENGDFSNPTSLGIVPGGLSMPITIPTALAPGTGYQIRITSSTPALVDTLDGFLILDPPPVQGQIVFDPPVVCLGAPVTVTRQGGLGSLQWEVATVTDTTLSTGDSTTIAKVEAVTRVRIVTTSGLCPADTSKFVNVPIDPIQSDFTFSQPTFTDFFFFDASTNASAWEWDFGGLGTSGSSNPTFNFPGNEMYTVCLEATSPAGCKDTSCQEISTVDVSSIEVPTWAGEIQIGPVPVSQQLNIYGPDHLIYDRIFVQDLTGKIWVEEANIRLPHQISVQAFPEGFFILNLVAEGETFGVKWLHLR
ncbi:MAG: PKD domain-containing protein [Bacteroidota bacterium]